MKQIFLVSLLISLPAQASCPVETEVALGHTVTLVKTEQAPRYHWHATDKSTAILTREREWTSPVEHKHAAVGTSQYYFAEYRGLAKGLSDVWLEYAGHGEVIERTCVTVEVY